MEIKKLMLFCMCLVTLSLQARYYKATLTYKDGTIKTGYSDLVSITAKNVRFKADEKSRTEKISSEELVRIVYFNEFGNSIAAERFYTNSIRDNGGIKKSKNKEWYYVYYSDGIKVAGGNAEEIDKMLFIGEVTWGAEVSYYLGKEKEEDIYYLFYDSPKNLAVLGGFDLDEQLQKVNKQLFQESCPDMITKIENEKFKFKDVIQKYIDIYKATCK